VEADTRCPGCGARNPPGVRACAWCGRPTAPPHGRWRVGVAAAGAVCCSLGALGVAVLLAGARPSEAPSPPASPVLSATATPDPAPAVVVLPAAAPEPEPEPTPERVEYVRVANTDGLGLALRQEPSTAAARVVARPENTLLRLVGPDRLVDGRLWRPVEDLAGHRGWAPAEFLAPALPAAP
jgi:hypothetical protein